MRAILIVFALPIVLGCKESTTTEPAKPTTDNAAAQPNSKPVNAPSTALVTLYTDGSQKTLELPGGALSASVASDGVDLMWKGTKVTSCDFNVTRGNGVVQASHQGDSVYVVCNDMDENIVTVVKLALGDVPSVKGQVVMDNSADLTKLASFDYKASK